MACSGCQKRRTKIAAAYRAVRFGMLSAGHKYRAELSEAQERGAKARDSLSGSQWSDRELKILRERGQAPMKLNVIDIRE